MTRLTIHKVDVHQMKLLLAYFNIVKCFCVTNKKSFDQNQSTPLVL